MRDCVAAVVVDAADAVEEDVVVGAGVGDGDDDVVGARGCEE